MSHPPLLPDTLHWSALAPAPDEPAQARAVAWLAQRLGRSEQSLQLQRDENGRPCLRVDIDGDGIPDIDLNWSHSGELLLVRVEPAAQ